MRGALGVVGAVITILGLPSTWDDLHHKWPGIVKFIFGENYGPALVLGGVVLIVLSVFWHKIAPKASDDAGRGVRSEYQSGGQTGLLNVAIAERGLSQSREQAPTIPRLSSIAPAVRRSLRRAHVVSAASAFKNSP